MTPLGLSHITPQFRLTASRWGARFDTEARSPVEGLLWPGQVARPLAGGESRNWLGTVVMFEENWLLRLGRIRQYMNAGWVTGAILAIIAVIPLCVSGAAIQTLSTLAAGLVLPLVGQLLYHRR